MRKGKKWIWGSLILIVVVGFIMINVFRSREAFAVQLTAVKEGIMDEKVYTTGKLEPIVQTECYAPSTGIITQLGIEEGQNVEEGQELMNLDLQEIKDQLKAEEISLALTEFEREEFRKQYFNKMKKQLYEDVVEELDPLDLTSYDLKIENSRIRIDSFKAKLEKSQYHAPTSGTVVNLSVKSGQMVNQGMLAMTIADLTKYQVKILINEQDSQLLKEGMRAVVKSDSFEGELQGKVSYLSPIATIADATAKETTVQIRIELDSTSIPLRSGYNTTVEIIIPDKKRNILPAEAVTNIQEKNYVYVVENGIAKKKEVTLGKETDMQVEVLKGLTPGEKVIATITPMIQDGKKVITK